MPESEPQPEDNSESALFKKLEAEDFGPRNEKERAMIEARNALCVQFDEMMNGRGGESMFESQTLLGEMLNDSMIKFFELAESAADSFDHHEAVTYIAEQFQSDQYKRLDMLLTSAGLKEWDAPLDIDQYDDDDEADFDFSLISPKLAYQFGTAFVLAHKAEPEEQPQYDSYTQLTQVLMDIQMDLHRGAETEKEDALGGLKQIYARIMIGDMNNFASSFPPNLIDFANHQEHAQQELALEQAQYNSAHRRELVANFGFHVVSAALGAGIALAASKLFGKRRP